MPSFLFLTILRPSCESASVIGLADDHLRLFVFPGFLRAWAPAIAEVRR
ncbi:hypothetical protein QMA71_26470 [Pseudomonas otitidis]|nr:hypothetical protein [Pseudomonas otitidis]MDI6529093.1 hypothetical protein [Pseudomonas otitidis]